MTVLLSVPATMKEEVVGLVAYQHLIIQDLKGWYMVMSSGSE